MSAIIVLDDAERRRFAAYLLADAAVTDGLIAEMEKIRGGVFSLLIEKYKSEAAAQRLVALKLGAHQEEVLR